MTVKFEIKDQLARLLAQEDLVVEHKNVETASFDVDRRILVLPNWNRASEVVYDLLVGHEVGHALYTPNEDFSAVKAPKSYLNVTEDARIEKLMKRRFPGLSKCFFRGYKELNDEDFFGTKDVDISKFSLIDRINLYFKGNLDIKFSPDEQEFVDIVSKLETFADACLAAELIYKFTKEQKEKENVETPDIDSTQDSSAEGKSEQVESQQGDSFSDEDDESNNETPESSDQQSGGSSNYVDQPGSEPEPEEGITDKNLQEKIEQLAGYSGSDTIYVEVPEVNTKTIVVPSEKIWKYFTDIKQRRIEYYSSNGWETTDYTVSEYNKFKQSAQKEVNYLVKEFECRKSASAYARATVSRTGVLDTSKLHTYMFNDDIFKKVSIIPDGKNHGLVFILDWSGSMQNVLMDTVKQLLNLVWFCRKVNIPFEVYAFTNEWFRNSDDPNIPYVDHQTFIHQEKKPNDLIVNSFFSLLNFISSKSSAKDFEDSCKNLFSLAYSPMDYARLGLSGTPLNESIITLYSLIPEFKKTHGVEKLNTIILTDGEAQYIPYIVEYKNRSGEMSIGSNSISNRCALRDRKLGRVYKIDDRYVGLTTTLLKNLDERFPEVNIIGIRLSQGSDLRRFLTFYSDFDNLQFEQIMTKWRKEKSVAIDGLGYTKYFVLSSSSLSNDTEFVVSDTATKSQIKSAFAKSLKSKKLNKKILSEFVELIA